MALKFEKKDDVAEVASGTQFQIDLTVPKKVELGAAQSSEELEILAVDAAQHLKEMLDKVKPLEKAYEEAKSRLKALFPEDVDEDEEVVLKGTAYEAVFSACSEARTIHDMKTVHKMLGDDIFYQLATIKLTDLDKYIAPHEQEKVVVKHRSATRVLKFRKL